MTLKPTLNVASNDQGAARLDSPAHWARWIQILELQATTLGFWVRIDPEKEDKEGDLPYDPIFRTFETFYEDKQKEHTKRKDMITEARKRATGDTLAALPPIPASPTLSDIDTAYDRDTRTFDYLKKEYKEKVAQDAAVDDFIVRTANEGAITATMITLKSKHPEGVSKRQLLRGLRDHFAISQTITIFDVRQEYKKIMAEVTKVRSNPQAWLNRWNAVYARAKAYKIYEVEGNQASIDFLLATKRFSPFWAQTEMNKLITHSEEAHEVIFYAQQLTRILDHGFSEASSPMVHATLSGEQEPGRNSASRNKNNKDCPCKRKHHPWKPEDSLLVKTALTNERNAITKDIPEQKINQIRAALNKPHWSRVKAQFLAQQGSSASGSTARAQSTNWDEIPRAFITIDPSLLEQPTDDMVMFTQQRTSHPLGKSTCFDTCAAVHVVNDRRLLVPGSYEDANGAFVQAGSGHFEISGFGTRVLEKVLNGPEGARSISLTLEKCAVIEGFHTNLVSAAALQEKGVWYCGFDKTLRWGPINASIVLAQLEMKYKLTILQYKPIRTCLPAPEQENPFPKLSVVYKYPFFVMAVMENKPRRHRRSIDPPLPRADTAYLWHIRAGHLGKDALERLVSKARGVKIKGISRIECETCATTYARRVVSRRSSERRSPRPFWRVHWDLQDYEEGYNGCKWLLLLKDEYSGCLYAYPLVTKGKEPILNVILLFDRWVKRQFGLVICILRSDNEKAVITRSGNTEFQAWARSQGIEIENSPVGTHEPNGGIERVNQEVTDKSNAMLNGACLPPNLWPESTVTAAHLLNQSPRIGLDGSAPIEVLESWFRNHAPLPIREHTADLRPDWSRIYAYGCKAYPLIQERLEGKHRRAFKTSPRAHVGYLVGYTAHNLYRVWLPLLGKVIITRDIRFDENTFYEPKTESLNELTVQELGDWVLRYQAPEWESEAPIDQPSRAPAGLNSGVEIRNRADNDMIAAPQSQREQGEPDSNVDPSDNVPQGTERTSSQISVVSSGDHTEYTPVQAPRGFQTPRETPERSAPLGSSGGARSAQQGDFDASRPPIDSGDDSSIEISDRLDTDRANQTTQAPLTGANNGRMHAPSREMTAAESYLGGESASPSPTRIRDEIVVASRDDSTGSSSEETTSSSESSNDDREAANPTWAARRSNPAENRSSSTHMLQESVRSLEAREAPDQAARASRGGSTRGRTRAGRQRGSRANARAAAPSRSSARIQERREDGRTGTFDRRSHELHRDAHVVTFMQEYMQEADASAEELKTAFCVLLGAADMKAKKGKQASRMVFATSSTEQRKHRDDLPEPPKTHNKMLLHPLRSLFEKAMKVEIDSLREKRTWREVRREKARSKPLPVKWVYTYKCDQDGFLERCKARLVVCGNFQESAMIENTYAATLAARSFRVMMALAAHFDLEIIQMDIKNAFVNAVRGPNDEPVTCRMPPGVDRPGYVLELHRALYGLRDSPKLWFDTFAATLHKLGLEPCKEEPCLFYSPKRDVYLVFFVDDILIFYHRNRPLAAQQLIQGLKGSFELTYKENAEWFLGIRIIRDRQKRTISLCHDSYIEKVAQRFGQHDRNSFPVIPIPVIEFEARSDQATRDEVKLYQEEIGSVLYTSIMIRADIAYAASILSRFLTNPSSQHKKAADQTIRYLYLTRDYCIVYGSSSGVQGLLIASDASFADDASTRRSSQGYLITLFGGLILWKASRQATVTTSTTEAELLALEQIAKETMSLKRLFAGIRFDPNAPWEIYCDNQQTIRLVVNQSTRITTRLRHVDIQSMWLKQEYEKGSFKVAYLATADMPADGLTKALPRQKFEHFRALLNMSRVITEQGK
uniref:WGS project CBMG000000000 data, contig CS5907-c000341 n=1 Tax=Fusarium acuminatum CS5907 TaxID=1318461 RepID=A0A096PEX3_9HYPO|nr:unnamed protein product [Fusarium acuminatum CS5907]